MTDAFNFSYYETINAPYSEMETFSFFKEIISMETLIAKNTAQVFNFNLPPFSYPV